MTRTPARTPLRRCALLALPAAGLLALSACGGSKPTAAPTPSAAAETTTAVVASASPSPSVGPTAFVFDNASAKQFVIDYYAALNTSVTSGDTSAASSYISAECQCRKQLDVLSSAFSRGIRLTGGQYTLSLFDVDLSTTSRVSFHADLTALDGVDANGAPAGHDDAKAYSTDVLLVQNSEKSNWLISSIDSRPA